MARSRAWWAGRVFSFGYTPSKELFRLVIEAKEPSGKDRMVSIDLGTEDLEGLIESFERYKKHWPHAIKRAPRED